MFEINMKKIEVSKGFFEAVKILMANKDYQTALNILNSRLQSGEEDDVPYNDFLIRFLIIIIKINEKEESKEIVKEATYLYNIHRKFLDSLSDETVENVWRVIFNAFISEEKYGIEAMYYASKCLKIEVL